MNLTSVTLIFRLKPRLNKICIILNFHFVLLTLQKLTVRNLFIYRDTRSFSPLPFRLFNFLLRVKYGQVRVARVKGATKIDSKTKQMERAWSEINSSEALFKGASENSFYLMDVKFKFKKNIKKQNILI